MLLLAFCFAVLPFAFNPLRLEGHEPHRAALIAVVATLYCLVNFAEVSGFVRNAARRAPLPTFGLAAVVLLACLSTALSLGPADAFFGDTVRRDGLLSILAALLLGLCVGSASTRFASRTEALTFIGRAIWFGALGAAAYALLQQARLLPTYSVGTPPRSSATFGYPTYAASFFALALLLTLPGLRGLRGARRIAYLFGMLVIGGGLFATGSRGALVGLLAGVGMVIVGYAAVYRRRWIVVPLLVVTLLGAVGGLLILLGPRSTAWRPELILRKLEIGSREAMWTHFASLFDAPPTFVSLTGEADRFQPLRRWIGYGPEQLDLLDHFNPAAGSKYNVDRAHNLFLDVQGSFGLAGLVARIAVFAGAVYVLLNRLRLPVLLPALAAITGAGVALLVADTLKLSAWRVPALTYGALAGVGGALLILTFRRAGTRDSPDTFANLVLLAAVSAYLVDHSLTFETVIMSALLWSIMGLILAEPSASTLEPLKTETANALPPYLLWASGLGAALLMRNISYAAAWSVEAAGVLLVALGYGALVAAPPMRRVFLLLVLGSGSALGLALSRINDPMIAMLAEAALWIAAGALALVLRDGLRAGLRWPVTHYAAVGAGLLLTVLAVRDAAGDAQRGRPLPSETAAQLRPFDPRVVMQAGVEALNTADTSGAARAAQIDLAWQRMQRAAALAPYDVAVNYRLVQFYVLFARSSDEAAKYRTLAENGFRALTQIAPYEAGLWQAWAEFTDDPRDALPKMLRAAGLQPTPERQRAIDALRLMLRQESRE